MAGGVTGRGTDHQAPTGSSATTPTLPWFSAGRSKKASGLRHSLESEAPQITNTAPSLALMGQRLIAGGSLDTRPPLGLCAAVAPPAFGFARFPLPAVAGVPDVDLEVGGSGLHWSGLPPSYPVRLLCKEGPVGAVPPGLPSCLET